MNATIEILVLFKILSGTELTLGRDTKLPYTY